MEFYQLEAFVRVCEHKSFSRAAEALFLTQPTVSAHIIALEKELNAKLFDRGGREVGLTPVGEVLYEKAVKILKEKEKAVIELKYFMGSVEGEQLLISSSIPAVYVLPTLIKEFNSIYPKVVFKVRQADSGIVLNTIMDGRAELGVSGMKNTDRNLEFIPFCNDELVLATPVNWSSLSKKSIKVEKLFDQKLIVRERESGTRRTFERALKNKGFKPEGFNIAAEFGSSEAIKQAIIQGLGVSIISKRAVEDYIKMNLVRIFRIEGINLNRYFYFVFKKGKTLSPNAENLIKFVTDSCKTAGLHLSGPLTNLDKNLCK
jgi:DNA-binding transcriptional LysR family regulator